MSESIYIFTSGEIKRKHNTIYFETSDGTKKYLPIENVRDIHFFGEVTLNKELLEFISRKEIILHFYNYYEYYTGSFYPREHYNSGYMILKQAEHYLNKEKRLELAKSFVNGAAENIKKVLSYYIAREKESLKDILERIESLQQNIDLQEDVEAVMGIEGNIRDTYYSAFNKIVDNEEFKMEERTKRPPTNCMNALISFGNSLMYTTILSEIYKTHLDPRIGYLHTTNFRRFSLNLDIAEIFKPIIIDRIIFSMVNKREISEKDFEEKLQGIYLKEKGMKLFIQNFEEKMKTTIQYKNLGKVSYRRLIRVELYKLEKHLIGEEKYKPYISSW
ncbi:MAG TPA: type I-B CRISPR-associated endonuclease Cas1b [Dictyoglomaceae bacterium]|nr:type I-B CRISPR-associated endonuclease Cas1b [Dictyoglomaceae bacterium]HOL39928.1 type I-B CRISPR-associated endonuclease Cas1b [Dictyoglomaceae bacterium]HOP95647.1 type I-B CRISPR-associated endonuclease Cas1b [Dictyoglomaceae bacterium]HPP16390.1 type I-B CRISPR-associated endonuclease Cas1b [Dictyoglomaceae bacterium]HPU44536.1 type I-B CRISPR-associated endonuclease Cas1b [Dictyoglomaceae bacterium]